MGTTNFHHVRGGVDSGTAATLPEPEEDELEEAEFDNTAAERPLVFFPSPGACDSTCCVAPDAGPEDEELTAADRPDSRSRFSRSSSDLISTACW
jgi:hypothetical protein